MKELIMKVFFVGAGPGDAELLTLKADRLLRETRCVIFAGSLVGEDILARIPETAECHDSAKMTLEETTAVMLDCHKRGMDVIRLHSGEPALYGAIGEQMRLLDKAGIAYEVVPGISSFQAAAAAIKKELTSPEVSQTVVLTRTPGRTPMPESEKLATYAATGATLCLFLSTHKIQAVCEELSTHYGSDCPAAVVFHASRKDQQVITAPLSDLAEKVLSSGIRKTAQILVGRAIGGVEHASKLYDADFTHDYRKANRVDPA